MNIQPDENGNDSYYDDWLWGCQRENAYSVASNGQRVTAAIALQIAADVLRFICADNTEPLLWTHNDYRLARSAISGIRAQGGCFGPDASALGRGEEGLMLTEVCDIAVYG